MSKQIIVLDKQDAVLSYRVAFWAVVPVSRKPYYVNASATSEYKDISAGELTSLQDGSVVEKVGTFLYGSGTSLATIKADLIAKFSDFQSQITNFNPYDKYGTFYDGTGWTNGGVV